MTNTGQIIDTNLPGTPFDIVGDIHELGLPLEHFFWTEEEYMAKFEYAKNNAFLKAVMDVFWEKPQD